MRTQTIEIFKFNELSDDAKENARQDYRVNGFSYDWWDCVYEDAAIIAELFGLDIKTRTENLSNGKKLFNQIAIYFSGFSSQGDGACYEGSYSYKKGGLKAVKEYAPVDEKLHAIVKQLQDLQRRYFYKITAKTKHQGHYSHEYCMYIDAEHENPKAYGSDYLPVSDHDALTDILRSFAKWIYKQLEAEFDGLNTDEAIDETIEANDWEFYANGEMA